MVLISPNINPGSSTSNDSMDGGTLPATIELQQKVFPRPHPSEKVRFAIKHLYPA
jgi:hypothetical protein